MDIPVRATHQHRTPLLLGHNGMVRTPDRPPRDERIDVPEVAESTQVSFSDGIAIRPGFPTRSGVARYLDIQRDSKE